MDSKRIIWLFMAVGTTIGGALPLLWGAGEFSFSSVILAGLGGFLGIYFGYKVSR